MPVDEKDFYSIRSLQLVLDAQAILENLDTDDLPNPEKSKAEFEQVRDILQNWERWLIDAVDVDTDMMKLERRR